MSRQTSRKLKEFTQLRTGETCRYDWERRPKRIDALLADAKGGGCHIDWADQAMIKAVLNAVLSG